MSEDMYDISLPPQLLARGFWLYVWKIDLPDGTPTYYVGITGDTGSKVAQSPFNRVCAHLSMNTRSNTLRRCLRSRHGSVPKNCRSLNFKAFGPIGSVPKEREEYRRSRAQVAALESALWLALERAGYAMLNKQPRSLTNLDKSKWSAALMAVAGKFDRLGEPRTPGPT